ncbi:MAG: D-alanine--D-alanine ligase [Bacteroidetes bacterium]|nr:D-alanine--D-alanine ligase [Bacteroidota bacterium]
MKKINVAVVAGGDSTEREISIKGGNYVINELNKELYNSTLVTIKGLDWTAHDNNGLESLVNKDNFSFTAKGKEVKFDFAVILIHGTPGENGILQSYFELLKIPYSTSGVLSSAITFDKTSAKAIAQRAGVNVAKEVIVKKGQTIDTKAIVEKLGLPLFVKPSAAGSSFGITKVKKESDIIPSIEKAYSEDSKVLVEEFLEGREVSCGIFTALGKEYILPITEIISETEYFDYDAKYLGKSKEVTPADISIEIMKNLNKETSKAYKALFCEALVRIDFIIKGDVPYMVEVNSIPGMSAQSIVPQQLKAMGMTTGEMFDLVIADKLNK